MQQALVTCTSIIVLATASPAAEKDVPLNAIVRIEARGQTEKGRYVRTGSGFLVGNTEYVLTARHLVVPESPIVRDEVTGRLRFSIYVDIRDKDGILRDRREAFVYREDQ